MKNELIKRAQKAGIKIRGFVEVPGLPGEFVDYQAGKVKGKASLPSFKKFLRRKELEKEIRVLEKKRQDALNSIHQPVDEIEGYSMKIQTLKDELKRFMTKKK